MADNTPSMKTETKSSLPFILIFLSLVAGVMFYFQILKPGEVNEYVIPPDIQTEYTSFKIFKSLALDFTFFETSGFRNLRTFGESPVRPLPGGKTDLFGQ